MKKEGETIFIATIAEILHVKDQARFAARIRQWIEAGLLDLQAVAGSSPEPLVNRCPLCGWSTIYLPEFVSRTLLLSSRKTGRDTGMTKPKFGITENGDVYLLNGGFRKLGHIEQLTKAHTPIGREVRQWWQKELVSDEPMNLIEAKDVNNGARRYELRAPNSPAVNEDSRQFGEELVP